MPLPILGIAARAVFGRGDSADNPKAASPRLTFRLEAGGRGFRKAARRITRDTERAALRATNRAGRWGRTRVRRELSQLLSIPAKSIRDFERRASAGKRPVYIYRVYRREYHVSTLKGVRFRPYRGQSREGARVEAVGRLRYRAYGKQHTFERVMRRRTHKGLQYLLLPPQGSSRRPKRVMGTWVKEGYRGPRAVKKQIPREWRKEFRRQRRLLAKKRRR